MATRARASSQSSSSSASSSGVKFATTTKAVRPRLGSASKRVSFDATSVPLPSATWEEFATPSTIATAPPFPFPTPAEERGRDLRKFEIDNDVNVDLKAVLAAGIIEWRNEIDPLDSTSAAASS